MDECLPFRIKPEEDKRAVIHKQIDHMAAFVKKIKPWEMTPDDTLVKSGTAFALVSDKELAAYLPSGGSATLDLAKLTGTLKARWYNPLDGKFGEAFKVQGGGQVEFKAPDDRDWALLIKRS